MVICSAGSLRLMPAALTSIDRGPNRPDADDTTSARASRSDRSAEHVSTTGESLDLAGFIEGYGLPVIVGGCATYDAALDLSGGTLTAAWLNRSLANRGLGLVAEADIDLQMATGRPPSGGASLPADDAAPVALSAPARAGAAPDSRSR